MKLIAYYSIYNEKDFIKQSLESICPFVDKTIIIEGAWKETYMVNGNKRSNDGTIKIVEDYIAVNVDMDIEFHHHSEDSQLAQRNALWQYLDETCIMLLVDGDEVWTPEELDKIRNLKEGWPTSPALPAHVYTVNSLIFINDFYNVSEVRYPRAWELEKNVNYNFVEPNRITANEFDFETRDLPVHYYHYSYCHNIVRFQEKKKERTRLHGSFAWEQVGEIVTRDDANISRYDGRHPVGMRDHPLFGVKKHKKVSRPEIIVYVEHSGIGNLVLSTPMLQALRQAKPDAQIHVVSWKRAFRILEGADFVDSVIPVDEGAQHLAPLLQGGIDHLLISPVGALDQVVSWLSKVSKKVHKLNVTTPWTQHEALVKMQLAKRLGFRGPAFKCSIKYFEYNRHAAIFAFPEPRTGPSPAHWIAIDAAYLKNEHWHKKHWGDSKFAEIVDLIHSDFPDLGFVFVGGPEDRGDAERIISLMFDDDKVVINRCGYGTDIKDTAAILSGSVACIGNDGGLQHIAAAVGTPTCTIFTFTNPVKNRPFGPDKLHPIVMKPCSKRLMCQHGNHNKCECLDVPIKNVFEKVSTLLEYVLAEEQES